MSKFCGECGMHSDRCSKHHACTRRSARSWLSSFSSQTAYRPLTIVWRYFHTSIFTSRRDGPEQSGHVNSQYFEIVYFQKFCLSRPGHFPQKSTNNHQKKIGGATPRTYIKHVLSSSAYTFAYALATGCAYALMYV